MMKRYTLTFAVLMLASFIARAVLAVEPATKPAAVKTAEFQNADKTFTFKYPAVCDREYNTPKNTVLKLDP